MMTSLVSVQIFLTFFPFRVQLFDSAQTKRKDLVSSQVQKLLPSTLNNANKKTTTAL